MVRSPEGSFGQVTLTSSSLIPCRQKNQQYRFPKSFMINFVDLLPSTTTLMYLCLPHPGMYDAISGILKSDNPQSKCFILIQVLIHSPTFRQPCLSTLTSSIMLLWLFLIQSSMSLESAMPLYCPQTCSLKVSSHFLGVPPTEPFTGITGDRSACFRHRDLTGDMVTVSGDMWISSEPGDVPFLHVLPETFFATRNNNVRFNKCSLKKR